jgi:uncharacterized protein (TIGR03067 family)
MRNKLLILTATIACSTVAFAQGGAPSGTQQATAAKPAAAMSKTLTDLQGTWVFTTTNGNDMTGQPEVIITITDTKYVQTINGEVVERGSFRIDDTKKPMQVDMSISEGQDAGKSQMGVFELSGGVLKAKMANAGDTTRPTDFAPADEAFVFTAVKKK